MLRFVLLRLPPTRPSPPATISFTTLSRSNHPRFEPSSVRAIRNSSPKASALFECPKNNAFVREYQPIANMTNPVIEIAPPSNAPAEPESAPAADEDCSKDYEPVVKLEQIETKTGEEDEEVLFKIRSKLFRFSKELTEWKERGTGDVRILKHKHTKKIRLLMRREKTLKICMNQYVNPNTELRENVGSERSWVWHAIDYADDERDQALLAIRFRDSKDAKAFKDAYDSAREHMAALRSPDANANQRAEGNGSASAETTTETNTEPATGTEEAADAKSS